MMVLVYQTSKYQNYTYLCPKSTKRESDVIQVYGCARCAAVASPGLTASACYTMMISLILTVIQYDCEEAVASGKPPLLH